MGFEGCRPGADAFIEAHFHDCVYGWRDYVGFYLGMLSIVLWIIAQLPQFISNIKNQSAEALSPWFLANWLLGDTCNCVGAVVQGQQLPTTTYTAMYFVVADVILMVQYIYYGALAKRRERLEHLRHHPGRHHRHHHHHHRRQAQQAKPHPSNEYTTAIDLEPGPAGLGAGAGALDGSGHGNGLPAPQLNGLGAQTLTFTSAGNAPIARCSAPGAAISAVVSTGAALLLVAGAALRLNGGGSSGTDMPPLGASPLLREEYDWSLIVGTVLGYISSVLYLMSRVSQICKNAERRSVEGLAITMFVCAMCANSCTGTSMLLRTFNLQELMNQAPWLVGSLGTIALDGVILAQSRVYRDKHPLPVASGDADTLSLPLLDGSN